VLAENLTAKIMFCLGSGAVIVQSVLSAKQQATANIKHFNSQLYNHDIFIHTDRSQNISIVHTYICNC